MASDNKNAFDWFQQFQEDKDLEREEVEKQLIQAEELEKQLEDLYRSF